MVNRVCTLIGIWIRVPIWLRTSLSLCLSIAIGVVTGIGFSTLGTGLFVILSEV